MIRFRGRFPPVSGRRGSSGSWFRGPSAACFAPEHRSGQARGRFGRGVQGLLGPRRAQFVGGPERLGGQVCLPAGPRAVFEGRFGMLGLRGMLLRWVCPKVRKRPKLENAKKGPSRRAQGRPFNHLRNLCDMTNNLRQLGARGMNLVLVESHSSLCY